jgi:hypothetical protein
MDVFNTVCPECRKKFYADMLLYSLDVELHCPFCGLYFLKEDSPELFAGGAAVSAVARVAGGISKEMIYRPGKNE